MVASAHRCKDAFIKFIGLAFYDTVYILIINYLKIEYQRRQEPEFSI